jgi:UDP-sulfoquinovose synthase
MGLNVEIRSIPNPRKEAEAHYYHPAHTGLLELGLAPHYLSDDVLSEMIEIVIEYKEDINKDAIFRGVQWN